MRVRSLALALAFALAFSGCIGQPLVGKPAPAFDLQLTSGTHVNASSYHGKFLIIDLMATWCLPCRLEIAHLKQVQAAYGDRVVIVSVGADPTENEAQLDAFARDRGAGWAHGLDRDGIIGRALGMRIIPKLVIVDPNGIVVFEREGEVLPGAIASVIDPNASAFADRDAGTQFAIALLAGLTGFLAVHNPYRRFHRDGSDWTVVPVLAGLAFLGWLFSGLVSTRATYGSLAVGAVSLGAALWWFRARQKVPKVAPGGRALAAFDRAYEAAPHFALALVLGLSTTGTLGYAAPMVGLLVGLALGIQSRDAVPPQVRDHAGLAGLAIAGAGLLVFGARVFFA